MTFFRCMNMRLCVIYRFGCFENFLRKQKQTHKKKSPTSPHFFLRLTHKHLPLSVQHFFYDDNILFFSYYHQIRVKCTQPCKLKKRVELLLTNETSCYQVNRKN